MVLVKNWQFSHLFILGKKIPWKDVSRYSRKKNAFQGFKNMNLKKYKNCNFSEKLVSAFGQKLLIFPSFSLRKILHKNVFKDILERKNAFLGYKNKKFKTSKNWHFSKAVNPWFWSKNGHFSNFFFLGNIAQENVFYDILERKNDFLD